MSKSGGGCSSKGGASKGRGGSVATQVHRSVAIQTPANHRMRLRDALHDGTGCADRNVLNDFTPFAKYDRNDLNMEVGFHTGTTLHHKTRKWAVALARRQMKGIVDDSGYGWDDDEYSDALREPECRLLVISDQQTKKPVGFVDFRFTVQGDPVGVMEGLPCLVVNDCQLEPEVCRRGLGRHVFSLLELIARKQRMIYVMLRVVDGNTACEEFIESKLKGFSRDYTWVDESQPLTMWQKCLDPATVTQMLAAEERVEPSSPTKADAPVSPPVSPDDKSASTEPAPAGQKKKKNNKNKNKNRKKKKQAAAAAAAAAATLAEGGTEASESSSAEQEKTAEATSTTAEEAPAAKEAAPEVARTLDLDSQLTSAFVKIRETQKAEAEQKEAAACEEAARREERQVQVLGHFYSGVVEGVPTKATEEVVAIIHKRRPATREEEATSMWFQVLCSKLAKKYGANPIALWDALPKAEASTAEAVETNDEEADGVLQELMVMFEERNGREATEEEVKMWVDQMRGAMEDQTTDVD